MPAPWHHGTHLLGTALAQSQLGTTWPWCCFGMEIAGCKEPGKPRAPAKGRRLEAVWGHKGMGDVGTVLLFKARVLLVLLVLLFKARVSPF